MARVCTVCTHAERQEIDQALIAGALKTADCADCSAFAIGNAQKCQRLTREGMGDVRFIR